MKKLYTTILATLMGTSVMFAEEGTFSFIRNGEIVPNGSTVVVSEVEAEDWGDGMFSFEMQSGLFIRNNETSDQKLTVLATGIENYNEIQVCPDGNCRPWSDGIVEASFKNAVAAGEQVSPEIHMSHLDFSGSSSFSFKGSLTVRAYCTYDEEDYTEITLVFDTSASNINIVKNPKKLEIFNICGRMVGNSAEGLQKGIYIFRQGDVSRKVVIK